MLNQSRTDISVTKELQKISYIFQQFQQQEKAFREIEKILSRPLAISQIESSSRKTNEKIVEMHRKRIEYCLKIGFSPFL